MNRKQRYFAGVQRLMHSVASVVQNERGEVVIDQPKLHIHTVGGRSYDLNASIQIVKPEEDLPGYLEAIRTQLSLAVTNGWGREAFEKAAVDIQKVVDAHDVALKNMRDSMRTTPEPVDGAADVRAFRSVQLRYDPRGEAAVRRDKHAGAGNAYLERMSLAQFNITCRRPEALDLDDEKARRKVSRFQLLHDVLSLQVSYLAKKDSFFHQGGGWEQLREAPEFKALALELGQALHSTRLGNAVNETNADEGKNWVPGPILSSRIYPKIEEEARLLSAFETVPMAAKTVDSGVLGAHKIAYKLLENLADDGTTSGAKVKASLWTTKKFSLDAKLFAAGCVATPNWLQDAIAGADEILTDLATAMAFGKENWMLNGQLSGAIDSVAIASDDIRNMGDGLRKWWSQMKVANAGLIDVDMSTGITAEGLVKMFGQQLSYGNRPAGSIFIANTYAMAQMLVMKTTTGRDVVLTMNQLGDRATFRTGSLGQAFGRDILTTNFLSQTMDAGGIDAGTGDRTVLLHVFTGAVKYGVRLGMQVDISSDYRFFEYQEAFRAVERGDIAAVYDPTVAGNIFVSQGVSIQKV